MNNKSQCEIALEKMIEERDYWRKLANQSAKENEELKRQVERLVIHGTAFMTAFDVAKTYDAAIEKIQNERDYFKRQLDEREEAISEAVTVSDIKEANSFQEYSDQINGFTAQYGEFGVPLPIVWIQVAYRAVEKTANEHHNANTQLMIEHGEKVTVGETMAYLVRMAYMSGVRDSAISAFRELRSRMNTPSLICNEIMWELWQTNDVHSETVSRLDLAWIKKNISERIGSHYVLQEACVHSYRYEISKNGLEAYAANQAGLSADNLRKWLGYFAKVKEHGKGVPSDVETPPSG